MLEEMRKLEAQRPRDLGLLRNGYDHECQPVTVSRKADFGSLWRRLKREALISGLDWNLVQRVEVAASRPHAARQIYRRDEPEAGPLAGVVPAIRLAFEMKIEKPALQFAAIVGVKMRPVLQPVAFKPLLCGSGSDKTFEIAARVQALPAPIAPPTETAP